MLEPVTTLRGDTIATVNTVNSFIMSQRSQFVIFASDGEQFLIQANVPSLQMQDRFKCNKFIVFE